MAAQHILKKVAPWVAGTLGLIVLVLLGLLRTAPGHAAIEWLVAKATGGEVVVVGLDGALPNHLRAARIELHDASGLWLRAERVSLDWNVLPALWNYIAIHRLAADRIAVLRQQQPSNTASTSTIRIDIDALALPNIALGPALVGHPANLTARGSLHYVSRHDLSADMIVTRAGSTDRYVAQGGIVGDVANGRVTVTEGADGLLGQLIGLPGLSPVNLSATASGSRDGNMMAVTLSAGKLSAQGQGTISLADRRADIAFDATAPAMQLNDALGWASLAARGRVTGGFDASDVQAQLRIAGVAAGGFRAGMLLADVTGSGGALDANARLEGLQIPGSAPGLFAGVPVLAHLAANLSEPRRPLRFSLRHPLIGIEGTANTRGQQDAQATLRVPSLAPFGALLGGEVAGAASASLKATVTGDKTTVTLNGDFRSAGTAILARLLGHATIDAHAVLLGNDILASRLTLDGTALATRITGEFRAGRLDYKTSLSIKDLSQLTPALVGQAALSGQVTGPVAKALVTASGSADMASKGFARERVDISLHAVGLPQPASAKFTARGRFDKAPLTLNAAVTGRGAARAVALAGDWKSLALRADVAMPESGAMTGQGTLDLKSVGDLEPFTAVAARGAMHLAAKLSAPGGKSTLSVNGRATDLAVAGAVLGVARIDGVVADPFLHPTLSLNLDAANFAAQGWTGEGLGTLRGPLDALAMAVTAKLVDPQGAPADLMAGAVLNSGDRGLALNQLKAHWRDETLGLAAPARLQFAAGLSLDRLALTAGGGTITVSGRIAPKFDIALSAQDIKAETVSLFLPRISVSGTLSATAKLQGTLAAPQGTVILRGRDLRNRVYAVSAATAADLDARAELHGGAATVNATMTAGKSAQLTLSGEAPLQADGTLNLRLKGSADLVLLDPVLAAGGQRVRGLVQIDTAIAGTLSAPQPRGSIILSRGEFQDFSRGIRLHDIEANLKAQKDGIHLLALTARAGSGTVTASGTLDAWSPDMPLDITVQADNARPIVSDLLTAVLTGSARLSGELQGDMVLKGAITVPRAEVTLPQSFPPQVRTLNVRHRGEPPPLPPKHGTSVTLDLSVRTTGPVTLRGRGIDADLGGNLDISGLAQSPRIGGGFEMRRGTLTLAGQVLGFTTGKITFDGTGVRGRMDPALDFVASQTSGGVTAILTVGGYASLPKIALSSSPQLPQDEVLARLLFQQSAKQLSPLQLAEGAQALASMAGIGSGFSPLASLRGGLGLDRLSVGSGSGPTSGTTVEAGKYISRNIYVGARQGISGGTQAQVQIDLTRNLKAQATVSAGTSATATQGATAAQDSGSSIGLSYQFDY
jgi:translocation and assembly module TamB